MKKLLFSLLAIYILSLTASKAQEDPEAKLLKYFHKITSEEMMGWVEKLCSPEFNGRLTGTPEFIASAEWVAGKLKEWGVKPAGDNGSWFQWFDQPYTVVRDIGSLSMKIKQSDGSYITKYYNY